MASQAVKASTPAAGRGTSPAALRWVFRTTVVFLYTAAALRSVLAFEGDQQVLVLALLAASLLIVLAGQAAVRARQPVFVVYLMAQSAVVLVLLTQSDSSDFAAILLAIPVMQAVERWRPRAVALLIGLFALLAVVGLAEKYGVAGALPLVATYAAADAFFAAYALAARRAVEARTHNEMLAAELREANQRLSESSRQSELLGAARERQRLGRELHDSVTQTLFSMTLTAQSALLLQGRRSADVGAQLDQLDELAHDAMDEMAALAGDLPAAGLDDGLARALARHCTERKLREGLVVTLEVEGDEPLPPEHGRALLGIAQEGLNNVVKHAGVGEAVVRLRLRRPCRLEVEDQGAGFDREQAAGAGLGLETMRERAAGIGWDLTVSAAPGGGTRVVASAPDDADGGENVSEAGDRDQAPGRDRDGDAGANDEGGRDGG